MNALLHDAEPFTCWCCQRECYGERIASGSVLVCGPCDRLEPCPVVHKDLAPAHSPTEQTPPAPSPTSAVEDAGQPSEELGGGACALPSGWSEDRRGRAWMTACFQHESEACVWQTRGADFWRWAPDDKAQRGTAPTMLQAMCEALGLRISKARGRFWCVDTMPENAADTLAYDDIDDCARTALEAFHARQQTAPDLATIAAAFPDPCRCPRANMSGHVVHMPPCASYVQPAAPSSLSRLAAEGLELAARMRADALELEAWAARVRATGGQR